MNTAVSSERVYFPGLNGLRFLAAAGVIILHVEIDKRMMGLGNAVPLVANLEKGVSLFFALSGFLITYLLLAEIQRTKTIDVRSFYMRRMLRIWPLYYLVCAWSFFVLPQLLPETPLNSLSRENFLPQLVLYALLIPNIAKLAFNRVLGASQGWSVGVEEQFYLVWPLLMKRFARYVPILLLSIIAGKFVIEMGFIVVVRAAGGWDANIWTEVLRAIYRFLKLFRIEQMAAGGLLAYLIFQKYQRILNVCFHPVAQALILAGAAATLFLPFHLKYIGTYLDGAVFALLIANISSNPKSWLRLENRFFNRMGQISYGLYMYHMSVLALVLVAVLPLRSNPILLNVLLYGGTFLLTTVVATLSYHYYEQPFLRMKDRFALVKSSDGGFVEESAPVGAVAVPVGIATPVEAREPHPVSPTLPA